MMNSPEDPLQWNQIEEALVAARHDLCETYARVYFAATGELPDCVAREDLDENTKLEKGAISEREFFFDGLNGIYLGLNYAWSTRHIDIEKMEREGGGFQIATPTDGTFSVLVPAILSPRRGRLKISGRPISLNPVRMSLLVALRKLTDLCYRVSLLPEVFPPEKIERPKDLDATARLHPFEEEDLELRLAMVYSHLNEAWNRRFDATFKTNTEEVKRRHKFPREFLS